MPRHRARHFCTNALQRVIVRVGARCNKMHMHHDKAPRHAADSPPSSDPAAVRCACTTLRKASRAVTRLYDEAMDGTGMTTIQFSILRSIAREGADGLPLSRLAAALVMDRTTLYRAIAPIAARSWVALSPGKGRSQTVALTPAGAQAMAAAEPAWTGAQARLLGRIGLPEWRGIEASLARVVSAAQEIRA